MFSFTGLPLVSTCTSRDGRLMAPTGSGDSVSDDVGVVSAWPWALGSRRFSVPRRRETTRARLEAALKVREAKVAIAEDLPGASEANRPLSKRGLRTVSIRAKSGRSGQHQGDW